MGKSKLVGLLKLGDVFSEAGMLIESGDAGEVVASVGDEWYSSSINELASMNQN